MSDSRRGPVFKSGRDQNIAYTESGAVNQTVGIANHAGADIDIASELQALRAEIAKLSIPQAATAISIVDAAEAEAKTELPNKAKITGLVETAVKMITSADTLVERTDTLLPHLQSAATWLGTTWETWRPTLGL